ncbi:hypothetical protein NLI96_g4856 [Meripilus lineatus]|uniref:Uncharacterized protein n=1 Tax=Meripilus lineatus TaxID=2056292 RepID=A0AAD5YFC0_9APHY|nr:hypothetical protein NLI96_g4856 [Physisporinus lineatus]
MFTVSQHSLRADTPIDSSDNVSSNVSEYDPKTEEQSSDISMAIGSSVEGEGQEGEGGMEEGGDEDGDGDGDEQPSDVSMGVDSSSSVEGQGVVGEEGMEEGGGDGDGEGEEEELESEEVKAQSRRVVQFPPIPELAECIKFPDDTSDDESEDQSTSSPSRQSSTESEGQESGQEDSSSDDLNLFNVLSSPLFRRSPAPGPEPGTGATPAEVETDRIPDFVHLFARFDLRKKNWLTSRTVRPAFLVEIKKYYPETALDDFALGAVFNQVRTQAAHVFGDPLGRDLDVIGCIIGFGPLFTYVEFQKGFGKRGFVHAKLLTHSDPELRTLFGEVRGIRHDREYKSVKFLDMMSEPGHAALGAIKKRTIDLHEKFLKWNRPRHIEEIPQQITSPVISNAGSNMSEEF